jgi:hypothetical protein
MPLARYFALVGSALLALLFAADAYLPAPSSDRFVREARDVDKSVIRLKSTHKWPERIVFDTSLPTLVPQALVASTEAPVTSRSREAFAHLMDVSARIPGKIAPAGKKAKVAKRIHVVRLAVHQATARTSEALPAGW